MNELPPYLERLVTEHRISQSELSTRSRAQLRSLFDGGVLAIESAGRGEAILVRNPEALAAWVRQTFPAYGGWLAPESATRAHSVALRRDSKATGRGVGASVLQFRAPDLRRGRVAINGTDFPIVELTARHGLGACLIDSVSVLAIEGAAALVENLECFLQAEAIFPEVAVVMNASGRVSDRLLGCLTRSSVKPGPLWHLPDYDPVGLSDYLRLRAVLGNGVALFVPKDVERRFAALGNRKLITEKKRNRDLLVQLARAKWPCRDSERIFRLIKETGAGLEQESLLLKTME
jgi:hypothetical protein